MNQKQHWSKFALWEQATRTPFLIVAPGVTKPNQRCSAPVSLLDIYPTLVELCGSPRPKEIEGASLVPLLKDPGVPRAEPAVMTWGPNNHAVRDTRWRYIRYADGSEELYDHQNDRYEWNNLAHRPEHNETKQRLAQWLPKINKPLTTRTQWLPPGSMTLPADAPALKAERADTKPPVSAIAPSGKAALTLDDDQAAYTGVWTVSDKVPALLGKTYRHDGNDRAAIKTATFDFAAPASGEQSLRLLYQPSPNRSTRTTVTLRHGDQETRAVINQRRDPEPLGPFTFQKSESVQLIVSNEGADGHVVVDGLEVAPPGAFPAIPAAITGPPSSKPAAHSPRRPLTPERPRGSAPDEVNGKSFDLVIFGGTPGGIAMAVRAAREGLDVLLVNYNDHLGGILSSGLRVWDTLYEGKRAPVYDEARQRIFDYYRDTYGKDSPQYRRCLPGRSGHTNGQFEPAVAEHVLTRMVNAEPRITLLTGFIMDSARREGAMLQSGTFRAMQGEQTVTVQGAIFADCSYEGDLAAAAKVPYRVGRESREEFGEPHAGVIYMGSGQPETETERRQSEAHKKLNLRPFRGWQKILPGSTGKADHHVQAFNYRAILTDDPGNRLPVIKPEGYDRDFIATLEKGDVVEIPNRKFGWNRPQIIGPQDDYVEGNWPTRQRVMDQHWQATLGRLYFLQNDDSVPASDRDYWRNLGLAADEFTDNEHRPYEIYAREARRIVGRYVFTQLDGSLPDDLDRTSVHADSVGVTEWYFDTHACTTRRVPGSMHEGKMMLHESTFPGQVPYRCLLPQGLDNLLVPVCLSSTHVAWGTIRLEPTWMNIAESAAYAARLAKDQGITPAEIDTDTLLRRLAQRRVMITFFNDVDLGDDDPRVAAAQYFGTKGFFHDYNARLKDPLTESVRALWREAAEKLRQGTLVPDRLAREVRVAEAKSSPPTNVRRGDYLLQLFEASGDVASKPTGDPILAASAPEILKTLVDQWKTWADQVQFEARPANLFIPPAVPE